MKHTQQANLRIEKIRTALQGLNPIVLSIEDKSYLHAGHEGAKSGGHFVINITSSVFLGKTAIQRHQMVYEALGDLMQTDIHAVNINARSPRE